MKRMSPWRVVIYAFLGIFAFNFIQQVGVNIYRKKYAVRDEHVRCETNEDCTIIVNGCEKQNPYSRDVAVNLNAVDRLVYLQTCRYGTKVAISLVEKPEYKAMCNAKRCIGVETGRTIVKRFGADSKVTEEYKAP